MRDVSTRALPDATPAGPVRFSLGDAPEHARPALLEECFDRMGFAYEVTPLPGVPFEVDLVMHALPGLKLTAGKLNGSHNRRTRAMVQDSTDDVGLLVNLKGQHLITRNDEELVLAEGEAALTSCADPGSFAHQPHGDVLTLRFDRAQLAPLVNGADDRLLRRIPRDTPALKFLTSYIREAWDRRTTINPALQRLVATHVYDLTALMVGATRDAAHTANGRGLRAARLHAIKQDIARDLHRPDLSVTQLADRHGCTPRFVQRLFEAEGTTFTEYVLAQRLARAHRLLADPRSAAEKISTIAFDAGFADMSYFNRVFRRHYGDTPSGVRGACQTHRIS